MDNEELKTLVGVLNELGESYADCAQTIKQTTRETRTARKLWRNSRRSWLIKVGLALIAFPDPTISDIIGSFMVAAGLVQEGIKRRTLHVGDVFRTFQNALKAVRNTKDNL